MVNHVQNREDKRLIIGVFIVILNTVFMSFTNKCDCVIDLNLSNTIFNIILINKQFRGDLFFVLVELSFLFILYRRKNKILRLGFWLTLSKLIYNILILARIVEYDKGYSDFLGISIIFIFLIFDLFISKWKYPSSLL